MERRGRLATGTLAVGGLAALVLRPPYATVRLARHALPGVLFFVPTDRHVVALTVDDGPHPATTPALLDALAQRHARATFFVLGSLAAEYPDLLRRIVAEGHELGNHTWADERSACLPHDQLDASVRRTQSVLSEVAPVELLRPGSGIVTRRLLSVARQYNLRCVVGSVYPHDAHLGHRRYVAWDVVRRSRPGSIIVLHEGTPERARVAAVVDSVVPRLQRRGFEVTTVSNLLTLAAAPQTPGEQQAG
jgi:peptidoglycan/xylan/chitin deacetylase (PgdA/CDA1 family)